MHFLSNGPQNWLKEEVAGKPHTQEKKQVFHSFPADFPSNPSIEWLPPVLGALGDLIQQTGVGEWREKTSGAAMFLCTSKVDEELH